MYYSVRNRKAVETLDPVMQGRVNLLLHNLEIVGEDVLVYSAKRTPNEQDDLWGRGRETEGRIVTHVNDSNSFHVHGVAVDIVPVDGYTLIWDDNERWETIAREAIQLGFEWGFQMWGFDKAHFQLRQGLTIRDFKKGERLKDDPINYIRYVKKEVPVVKPKPAKPKPAKPKPKRQAEKVGRPRKLHKPKKKTRKQAVAKRKKKRIRKLFFLP